MLGNNLESAFGNQRDLLFHGVDLLFHGVDLLFHGVDHSMQVSRRPFDIEMFVLPGATFSGKHPTTMYLFKIAIRKLVSFFGILRFRIVDPQVPFRVFTIPMCLNKVVFLLGRWLVLAPRVPFIEHILLVCNEFFGVVIRIVVEFRCHNDCPAGKTDNVNGAFPVLYTLSPSISGDNV
jgi:hypothetical protein